MEQDILKFMEKVEIKNKEFAFYLDKEKGVIFPFNTIHLLARVDYLELDKNQYEQALFQKKIDDLDYAIINVKRAIPKYEITKNEKDKNVITEQEVAVRRIWNVSNTLGAFKSFTDKKEAIDHVIDINNKIQNYL